MPESDLTKFESTVLEAINNLEVTYRRQETLLKNIVDRHDRLVQTVNRKNDGDTFTGDIDLSTSNPRLDNHNKRISDMEDIISQQSNGLSDEYINDMLAEMTTRIQDLVNYINNDDRADNIEQRMTALEHRMFEVDRNALNQGMTVKKACESVDDLVNRLDEMNTRINFVQSIGVKNTAELSARLDNITHAVGNEVKDLNEEIYKINTRMDEISDMDDRINHIQSYSSRINEKVYKIADILEATPMLAERAENFSTNDPNPPPAVFEDTYYERLADGLSNGNQGVASLLMLSLRNMREEDIKTLMYYVKQYVNHNKSLDGLITE